MGASLVCQAVGRRLNVVIVPRSSEAILPATRRARRGDPDVRRACPPPSPWFPPSSWRPAEVPGVLRRRSCPPITDAPSPTRIVVEVDADEGVTPERDVRERITPRGAPVGPPDDHRRHCDKHPSNG